jgi:hypothetical protein
MAHSLSSEAYKSLIVEDVGKIHLTLDVCRRYCYNGFGKISVWGWDWIKSAEGGSPNLLLTAVNFQVLKEQVNFLCTSENVRFYLTVLFRASVCPYWRTVGVHVTGPSAGKHVIILKCSIHFSEAWDPEFLKHWQLLWKLKKRRMCAFCDRAWPVSGCQIMKHSSFESKRDNWGEKEKSSFTVENG